MNKQVVYTYKGANQDFTKSKHPVQYYYEAGHIRVLSTDTQSTGSITNEKGNSLVASLPDVQIVTASNNVDYGIYDADTDSILNPTTINYSDGNEIDDQIANDELSELSLSQKIIGHTPTREGVALFSTDNIVTPSTPDTLTNSNLVLYSEALDNALWIPSNLNVLTNNDGFAEKLVADTTDDVHKLTQVVYKENGATLQYTLSCYVKAAEYDVVELRMTSGNYPNCYTRFNLTTESAVGSGFTSAFPLTDSGIIDEGGGWYRIYITGTSSYEPTVVAEVRLNNGVRDDFAGNDIDGIHAYQMQLHQGGLTSHLQTFDIPEYTITPGTPEINRSMDCVWLIHNVLDDSYNLELLYVRSLEFSINNPIQAIFNYENENIQKAYWVDGLHQVRFLNLTHNQIDGNDLLIDIPSSSLDFVGSIDFSQPTITNIFNGGNHTSGMIQYGYNLYRLNSSQTKLSPLSELVPLDKDTGGGGELNEVVGAIPVIQINDIDLSYTHIKVYAIKYTSLNQIPSVTLIEERELSSNNITIYDDGTVIDSLSLTELLFLGSDPIVPKHIETKDNRLFLANIKTKDFILPDELETRAYGFPISSTSTVVYDEIAVSQGGVPIGTATNIDSTNDYNYGSKLDGVNLDYDTNKYQSSSTTIGGEGVFVKYEIVQKSLTNPEDHRLLKDREIYRIGLQFYNSLGQTSEPKWIADFKAPTGNLEGNYNTLNVELKPEFYTWLNGYTFEDANDIPVGYKVIRADRTLNDRTIICQGIVSNMMVNSPRDGNHSLYGLAEKRTFSDIHVKMPNILVRTFEEVSPLQKAEHLRAMQFGNSGDETNPLTEIQYDSTERKADTYQYSIMYQMYSPEVLFSSVSLSNNLNLNVVGGIQNTYNAYWGQAREIDTTATTIEGKTYNKLHPSASGGTEVSIQGNVNNLMDRGLIDDTNGSDDDEEMAFNQFYRKFTTFIPSTTINDIAIYGTPELVERGQGNTVYNNDSKFEYKNSLEGLLTDGEDEFTDDGSLKRAIVNVNSYGAKNITFVLGGDDVSTSYLRPTVEQLHQGAGLSANTDVALITEFVRENNAKYLGGIYGGNTYEDKKRTTYIELGAYNDISVTTTQIDSPGDTYVQVFKFERIAKTDTEVYAIGNNQFTEIVEFPVETSIDLKNRNDISKNNWDSKFQPRYDDYHVYNRVYSQQPNLVRINDTEFTYKRVETFDTRIQATKLKIPNESIDSWTDLLVNETIDLNGKYGPINSLVSFKDNIFSFQDESIAAISINPRVQIQGNDGVAVELGTGGILYDYNYITTKSGSINKWGTVATKKGIYYYDALNKSVGRVPDAANIFLSDIKGLHTYFNNNFNYSSIKVDNPLLAKGAVLGHDNYNNDIFITLLQGSDTFTWCYNELLEEFIDLKPGYAPSRYINKGEKLLITNTSDNSLYEQYAGVYNNWFGVNHPSYIILQINPESNMDCVFDNIKFNSEVYLNDIDQPLETLTHIEAYNEYQGSGRIPLIVGRSSNIRRKFREWKANIPRMRRNRMRNPWIFLKLELDNTSNYKMILHDIIVAYTTK